MNQAHWVLTVSRVRGKTYHKGGICLVSIFPFFVPEGLTVDHSLWLQILELSFIFSLLLREFSQWKASQLLRL